MICQTFCSPFCMDSHRDRLGAPATSHARSSSATQRVRLPNLIGRGIWPLEFKATTCRRETLSRWATSSASSAQRSSSCGCFVLLMPTFSGRATGGLAEMRGRKTDARGHPSTQRGVRAEFRNRYRQALFLDQLNLHGDASIAFLRQYHQPRIECGSIFCLVKQ
jgi:hypothetical protein